MLSERSSRGSKLVEQLDRVPAGARMRTWTLRDDNQQHYHGTVSITESPLVLRLMWRLDAGSPVREVGLFRIDLRALLADDYVRAESEDESDDRIRLRFVRGDDRRIRIQVRGDMPGLVVGEVPRPK